MKEEQQLQELMALGESGRHSCSPKRAWADFRGQLLRLVISPAFNLFNAFIILLNAIVLGLNW